MSAKAITKVVKLKPQNTMFILAEARLGETLMPLALMAIGTKSSENINMILSEVISKAVKSSYSHYAVRR
jgi:hypothetical protein